MNIVLQPWYIATQRKMTTIQALVTCFPLGWITTEGLLSLFRHVGVAMNALLRTTFFSEMD